MFDKWTQYSYRAQKYQRHKFLRFLALFFALYIVYNCITAFFFSVWSVNNDTMQPGLSYGDRLIFTSLASPSLSKEEKSQFPFKRGSVVLVDMGRERERKLPLRIIDGIVRFFTLQKVSIFSDDGQYYIKRVIALPGDEISMVDYVFRVKPSGSSYSLTEFELSDRPYHPSIPKTPSLWDDSVPFSGRMDAITLKPDECFVISDDRSNTNDSRTWGTVSPSLITARALLRFWPFVKIELF